MKKIIFTFILTIFFVFSEENVVFLIDENYPPYSYLKEGKIKGIYPEILEIVDKNLKDFKIIIKPVPWIRALKMIENGQAEYITDVWYRPNDRTYLSYSVPVINEEIIIVSLKKDKKSWPKDFKNKKIGINRGFAVFTSEEKKLINVEEANFTEDNIKKLLGGRIDYYASDKNSLYWDLEALVNNKKIKFSELQSIKVNLVFKKEYGYIGFKKNSTWKYKKKFEQEFNKEIEKSKSNGTINNIMKNNLKLLNSFE
jgi:ABC-type amino acid transport/signal transduction systems, periplasmic component/domain